MYRQQHQPRNRSVAGANLRNGPFFPGRPSSNALQRIQLGQLPVTVQLVIGDGAINLEFIGFPWSGVAKRPFRSHCRAGKLFVRQRQRMARFWRGWVDDTVRLI